MIYSCVKCYIIQSIYSQIIKKLEVDCYVFNSLLHVRTRSDSPGLAKNAGPSVVSQCDPRFDSTPHLKKETTTHAIWIWDSEWTLIHLALQLWEPLGRWGKTRLRSRSGTSPKSPEIPGEPERCVGVGVGVTSCFNSFAPLGPIIFFVFFCGEPVGWCLICMRQFSIHQGCYCSVSFSHALVWYADGIDMQ